MPIDQFYNNKNAKDGKRFRCKTCTDIDNNQWRKENIVKHREYGRKYRSEYDHEHGIYKPFSESKNCPIWLGDIAERLLQNVYKNVERMPRNHCFDFICSRGYKIDVKSSVLHNRKYGSFWSFTTRHGNKCDYFACIAFDNRENLNVLHFWLIPMETVRDKSHVCISRSRLSKWSAYEKSINNMASCCDSMKQ